MGDIARITVLVENHAQGRGLLAEHGLSFWIEINGRHLLFDTGQGLVLSSNADQLGVPLNQTDAVILSHGHYDHTGGVDSVILVARPLKVYGHQAVLEPKYTRGIDGSSHECGMPLPAREAIRACGDRYIRTEHQMEIVDGVFATGEIPRRTDFEDTGGPFFTDPDGRNADPLLDDQAVFFDTRCGIVVLLGCAHAGIINTLEYVRELTHGRRIHAVMGGMHLVAASRERMQRTVSALLQLEVERLYPAHCTGFEAAAGLWNAFPGKCLRCAVGTQTEFEIN